MIRIKIVFFFEIRQTIEHKRNTIIARHVKTLIFTFVQTIRHDIRVWVNADEGNHNSARKISLDHQSLGSIFLSTSILRRNFIIIRRHKHKRLKVRGIIIYIEDC